MPPVLNEVEDRRMSDVRDALASDLDAAFERLVLAYQDRLYSFALRMTGNRQDAEEVTQDALVRAYRALERYEPERIRSLALRPWLYRITVNLSRNRARGRRRPAVSLDELGASSDFEPGSTRDSGPEVFARGEQHAQIGAALAGLPRRYRAAVILRHVEGLTYREIAAALGQPAGTVKANVHRGVILLRQTLSTVGSEVQS
jgi:RNA polymerase sigma-70 factor (ECF subfamily)